MPLNPIDKNADIIVFGLGISGKSLVRYLINNGYNAIISDDNHKNLNDFAKKYQNHPSLDKIKICYNIKDIAWHNAQYLIMPPSMPINGPKIHPIVKIAKKNNCKIIGDIELFYLINKNKNFIGITGTNGKSTTTALTGHIFKENNINSAVGGNIGIPCFDLKESDSYILEISSYQLELSYKLHFKIAALLNITKDHLEHHGTMDNYIEAKKRIFLNQNKDDFALINIDNANCYKIYQELLNDDNFTANIIPISTKKVTENSINLIDNKIINNISKNQISISTYKNLNGKHNLENLLFAYTISYLNKITDINILSSLANFTGLKHRLQFIKKINNISYINDSKATNIISTLCALEAYDNIFWIAGGKSKNEDLLPILKYKDRIKKAFLIGEDQEIFANFLKENKIENHICDNLKSAFFKANNIAVNEQSEINIILSPACASFDQWQNFEERGDYFCQLVNKL